MAFLTACAIFKLQSGNKLDLEDITIKYRKLARIEHPDKSTHINSTERFQKLNEAHALLLKKIDDGKTVVPDFNKKNITVKITVTQTKKEPFVYEEMFKKQQQEFNRELEIINTIIACIRSVNIEQLKKYTNNEIRDLLYDDIKNWYLFSKKI